MEFKEFNKIERYKGGIFCEISEKIHGSNAQVLVFKDENGITQIKAGSRTRWLTPGKLTDNYGFAEWVENNKEELISLLGEGRYYGEWYGEGINAGYDLKEKRLALFDTSRFPPERPLPKGVDIVPVLFKGPYSDEAVKGALSLLKDNGSRLQPGFMRPEGIVVNFPHFGHKLKLVFESEDTKWRGNPGDKIARSKIDVSSYLQPIRLEKLLSRDSTYLTLYPTSLSIIAKEYVADLEKEDQVKGLDDLTIKAVRKAIYPWVRLMIESIYLKKEMSA